MRCAKCSWFCQGVYNQEPPSPVWSRVLNRCETAHRITHPSLAHLPFSRTERQRRSLLQRGNPPAPCSAQAQLPGTGTLHVPKALLTPHLLPRALSLHSCELGSPSVCQHRRSQSPAPRHRLTPNAECQRVTWGAQKIPDRRQREDLAVTSANGEVLRPLLTSTPPLQSCTSRRQVLPALCGWGRCPRG